MPSNTQYKAIIEMFRNCPFDNSYAHTLEPMDIAKKLSWLEQNCGYKSQEDRYEQYMYVRLDSATNKGTFKLQCLDIWAYSYNYAYINNLRGEVYFAFITGCRYVNDATQPTEVMSKGVYEFDFEIDLLMSNLHNVNQLKPCMVSRHHSESDEIGENIVAEPFSLLEEVCNDGGYKVLTPSAYGDDTCIIIYEMEENQSTGHLVDGVFSAAKIHVFSTNSSGLSSAQGLINDAASHGHPESILAIAMSKYSYLQLANVGDHLILGDTDKVTPVQVHIPNISENDTIDGYKPKNKKLYTYPYNYVNVVNCKGNDINLRYEFWKPNGNNLDLQYYCTRGLPLTMQIRPIDYKNNTTGSGTNAISPDVFIECTGFPLGTWSQESFEIWKAQNQGNILGTLAKSAVSIGAGIVTKNPITTAFAITNTIQNVVEIAQQGYTSSIVSDRFSGTLSGTSVNYNSKVEGFFYTRKSIPYENAKMIDNFFTRFGYAQIKLMTPNPTARPKYTFIQTSEPCYVNDTGMQGYTNGSANSKQIAIINRCFMNGITFWNRSITKDTIFQYDTLDNSPT